MSIAHLEIILTNRRAHEIQAGVRYEVLERAVAEFKAMAERVCSCKPEVQFEPVERPDEGKFASRKFAAIASCRADEELLFEETGLRTTAGAAEGVGA